MQILLCFLVKMALNFSKNAISSTPSLPISPQQFPLSQYCMKLNTKKYLTDQKIIFNHEITFSDWIS